MDNKQIIKTLLNQSPLNDIFIEKESYIIDSINKLIESNKSIIDIKNEIIACCGDYSEYVDFEAEELAEKIINDI